MLSVNEIFFSIQGESSYTGWPCVFVRLTGCDIRCSWCDTAYAFKEGEKVSVEEVISEVEKYDCQLVEITGGEPLLQSDVYPLLIRLLASGKTVLVETGGHLDISRIPPEVVKVVDVKCPGSGESHRNDWGNIEHLSSRDEVKFVIRDRTDYEFARSVVQTRHLDNRCNVVLFSPAHRLLSPGDLSSWVLQDRLPVRVQVQLHKYLWGDNTRGV